MSRKYWTEAEIQTLKELYPIRPAPEIAQLLGRSPEAIWNKARKLHLYRADLYWTPEELEQLKAIYPTYGLAETSKRLGRSEASVRKQASTLNLRRQRIWSAEEVALLKEMYSSGASAGEIAQAVGWPADAVQTKAYRLKLTRPPRWTPEELEQLQELYPTHSPNHIAELLGKGAGAVSGKAFRLRLKKVGLYWTQEEMDYLEDKWGKASLGTICKHLGRSPKGVLDKVFQLKLGAFLQAGNYITLYEFGHIYGNRNLAQCNLVKKHGLPVKRKKVRECSYRVIDLKEFWKWAEQNKDVLDLSRIRPHILGREPAWVADQRRKDIERMERYQTGLRWTEEEDQLLRYYLKQYKYTMEELSEKLRRSSNSVKCRIKKLSIKERPLPSNA